jgi:F420-non-reducing hydrogenase iron-sulfur subunit
LFEPKIVGFLCNWCTAAAADLAGTTRVQYPPNLIPIRVMCSGSVDTSYIFRALFYGADGVFIGGCHPGDCHYLTGNYRTEKRVKIVKTILKTLGLEDARVRLEWISASEIRKFVGAIEDFTETLRKLGPNKMSMLQ